MNSVRMAVIMMTAQRYFGMLVNFAMVAVVSRLLLPEEIGLAVIGSAVALMVLSAREFATVSFLVQKKDLTEDDIRVVVSVLTLVTCISALVLAVGAPWIAEVYEKPLLTPYLRVVSVAAILEIVTAPIIALMQREMAFRNVAQIMALQAGAGGITTVVLAATGGSSMAYAWAWLASASTSAILALYLKPDFSIFRPIVKGWRDMLIFGGYSGVNLILYRLYDTIPNLVLGHRISMDAVGLYNRAMTICQLPDKVFLSGIMSVGLSAFSAKVREEASLKEPYLRALSYITALQWPALVCIAILAHPIVHILLGSQWGATVPVVQVAAIALLSAFSFELNFPVLMALGAIREIFLRALVAWPLSAVILSIGAYFGLMLMTCALFVVIPFQAYVAIMAVRRHITMSWGEIFQALRKSSVVTLFTAAGPITVVVLTGFRFDLSIIEGIAAGLFAVPCWLAGLWVMDHPLLAEIARMLAVLKESALGRRLLSGSPRMTDL
jgi:O-antigen/teichoic acid export membrane protein